MFDAFAPTTSPALAPTEAPHAVSASELIESIMCCGLEKLDDVTQWVIAGAVAALLLMACISCCRFCTRRRKKRKMKQALLAAERNRSSAQVTSSRRGRNKRRGEAAPSTSASDGDETDPSRRKHRRERKSKAGPVGAPSRENRRKKGTATVKDSLREPLAPGSAATAVAVAVAVPEYSDAASRVHCKESDEGTRFVAPTYANAPEPSAPWEASAQAAAAAAVATAPVRRSISVASGTGAGASASAALLISGSSEKSKKLHSMLAKASAEQMAGITVDEDMFYNIASAINELEDS